MLVLKIAGRSVAKHENHRRTVSQTTFTGKRPESSESPSSASFRARTADRANLLFGMELVSLSIAF